MSNNIPILTNETEKTYLIYEGRLYRIWNNGIAEQRNWGDWIVQNQDYTLEQRQTFINIWKNAAVGVNYVVRQHATKPYILADDYDDHGKFLGFRNVSIIHSVFDIDSSCKGNVSSNDGLCICDICKEIVGIEYEHKGR